MGAPRKSERLSETRARPGGADEGQARGRRGAAGQRSYSRALRDAPAHHVTPCDQHDACADDRGVRGSRERAEETRRISDGRALQRSKQAEGD